MQYLDIKSTIQQYTQGTLTWTCSSSRSWSCIRRMMWTWECRRLAHFLRERDRARMRTRETCQALWYMSVTPHSGSRARNKILKVILGYIMNSMPTWATQNPIWNKGTKKIYPKNTIAKSTWNCKFSLSNTWGRQVKEQTRGWWRWGRGSRVTLLSTRAQSILSLVYIRNVERKNLPASSTELCIGQLVPSRAVYTSTQGRALLQSSITP